MNAIKAYSTRSFIVIVLFMLTIGGAVGAGIYFGLKKDGTLLCTRI